MTVFCVSGLEGTPMRKGDQKISFREGEIGHSFKQNKPTSSLLIDYIIYLALKILKLILPISCWDENAMPMGLLLPNRAN